MAVNRGLVFIEQHRLLVAMPYARRIIADNIARIRERMDATAHAAGRSPHEVQLIAVTKYVNAATAAVLVECGCTTLAESRPQQLWAKVAAPELAGARWHFVGKLQRNKVRRTLPLVELVHSVDSVRLLAEVDAQAAELGLRARVLIEINCSGEQAKQGFAADEARRLIATADAYRHVEIAGLMTMAALHGGRQTARLNFAALRELRDELAVSAPPAVRLDVLSMGMSGDFEEAIAEGATMVRIGSALFTGVSCDSA